MTKEKEDKIIAIASRSWLWSIPKKPSCLLDEVVIMMVENPEWALKQIPVIIDDDFWRSVWTENRKIKSLSKRKTSSKGAWLLRKTSR